MNLINKLIQSNIKNVMKKGKVTILCVFINLMAFNTSFSQTTVYSTIAKNINSNANSLQHNLNRTGDTLHLNSDYNLYKVEFIGAYKSKVFEVERGERKVSIPLVSVPVGEYTIAAFQIEKSDDIYQYQKTIVFRISRLLPIEDPSAKEELIAEAEAEKEEEKEAEEKLEIVEEKPEIKEEETIIKKEEPVVAEVKKKKPVKKKRVAKPKKTKKEVVKKERPTKPKKERVKKEVTPKKKTKVATSTTKPKKKTRIATSTPKPKKKRVEAEKPIREKKVISDTPKIKTTRITEKKEPALDSTEYKSYNLTNGRGGRFAVQSREEYRANNLRPNGEPYN